MIALRRCAACLLCSHSAEPRRCGKWYPSHAQGLSHFARDLRQLGRAGR